MRGMKYLTTFILLSCLPVLGQDFNKVKYINNYDGDTYRFDLGEGVPELFRTMPMRLYGIDTPEIKGKTKDERFKAVKAREFATNELKNAQCIDLVNCAGDKYFRILCSVKYDNKDLAGELIKRGYGYEYFGGKKKTYEVSED